MYLKFYLATLPSDRELEEGRKNESETERAQQSELFIILMIK